MLLELLFGFLFIGLFSFGGAYGAIPLIREVVLSYGWIEEEKLSYMIAVSESTPGPIMVNMATYIGSAKAGVPGAIVATFAVILPAFLIVILLTALLKGLTDNGAFRVCDRHNPCHRRVYDPDELYREREQRCGRLCGDPADGRTCRGVFPVKKSDQKRDLAGGADIDSRRGGRTGIRLVGSATAGCLPPGGAARIIGTREAMKWNLKT